MTLKSALLRLPPTLHRTLAKEARDSGFSFNQFCVGLLASAVGHPAETGEPLWLKPILNLYRDDGLLGVVLFGSTARGQARADSDVDLLLVFQPSVKVQRSVYRKFENESLAAPSLRKISIHCLSLPESTAFAPGRPLDISSLWLEVALEGQILWSVDGQVAQILDQIRKAIASGAYRRKNIHGQGYWVKA